MSENIKEKPLLAYHVQGYEAGVIVFANNSATARREGANQIDQEWDDIETCRRCQWADEYASAGVVPPLVMIEHGWWFECNHCGTRVEEDSCDGNDVLHEPVAVGRAVYCCQKCLDDEVSGRISTKKHQEEVRAAVLAKFPGATNIWVSFSDKSKDARFNFPGGKWGVNWKMGEDTVMASKDDVDAWNAYRTPFRFAEMTTK